MLDELMVDELVHQCDVVVHLAAAVGRQADRRAAAALAHHQHPRLRDRHRGGAPLPPQDPDGQHVGDLRQELRRAARRGRRPHPRQPRRRALGVQHRQGGRRDPRATPTTASAACRRSSCGCSTPSARGRARRTAWSSRASSARRCAASRSRSSATARRPAASATCTTSSTRCSRLLDHPDAIGEVFNVGSPEEITHPRARPAGSSSAAGSTSTIELIPYDAGLRRRASRTCSAACPTPPSCGADRLGADGARSTTSSTTPSPRPRTRCDGPRGRSRST